MIDTKARLILESLMTGVFIVDAETRKILDLNDAASEMIGYSRDEIIGMNCYDNVCQHGRAQCPVINMEIPVERTETTLIRKNGSTLPILKTAKRVKIGDRDCIIESFIEIMEQKEVETALRKSETLLNTIGKIAKIGGWEVDAATNEVSWTEET